MAEINGYIKGVQVYFLDNDYDKQKVAGIFAEKYGRTTDFWAGKLGVGYTYVECNLVQDANEAEAYNKGEKISYLQERLAFKALHLNNDNTVTAVVSGYASRCYSWTGGWNSGVENAPIYRFQVKDRTPGMTTCILYDADRVWGAAKETGYVIATFPGWAAYPAPYNDMDKVVDETFGQQGKSVLGSFVTTMKSRTWDILGKVNNLLTAAALKIMDTKSTTPDYSYNYQTLGAENLYALKERSSTYDAKNNKLAVGYYDDESAQVRTYGFTVMVDKSRYAVAKLSTDTWIKKQHDACCLLLNTNNFKSFYKQEPTYVGVYITGKKETDLLTAQGGILDSTTLAKKTDYASTTEYGVVKMAGKVDALADGATTAEVVDRLNTLIAYLKSAGLMSEN